MRTFILIACLICLSHFQAKAQTEFVLEPSQSMIMTGKGPGQDGTINPYFGQDCYAIIKNIGNREFYIRVQQDDKIIEEIATTRTTERGGRADDKRAETAMEDRKKQGDFQTVMVGGEPKTKNPQSRPKKIENRTTTRKSQFTTKTMQCLVIG